MGETSSQGEGEVNAPLRSPSCAMRLTYTGTRTVKVWQWEGQLQGVKIAPADHSLVLLAEATGPEHGGAGGAGSLLTHWGWSSTE
ncbi:hypothetical protein ElyMa_003904800 [Elysia marginata]|uniref:Uncharacterized protein n=1 Tax=Elysia marginata TaxID=1093978 RepID=A0AAV4FP61_9GAST|nr:hypothetical protein ElyMa_003904800 [Elysia marginata]